MHPSTNFSELQKRCNSANSFAELAVVALHELSLFEGAQGVLIICGPYSTGHRSPKENIKIFNESIEMARSMNELVFDQRPYEDRISYLRDEWRKQDPDWHTEYCMPILEVFYKRLIDSGHIYKAWFINGWEQSTGARWKHQQFQKLKEGRDLYEIRYLSPNFHIVKGVAAA